MNISYQRRVAPEEVSCCFLSPNSRPKSFLSPKSKFLKTIPDVPNKSPHKLNNFVNPKRQDIQSMKKSISTISLKKKNSEGIETNRTSLNQSQFVNRLQKKLVTHSMDSQVFKQYFPTYDKLNSSNSRSGYSPFEEINKPITNRLKEETLDSIAQKFKKNRPIQNQYNVDSTRRYNFKQYEATNIQESDNLKNTYNSKEISQNFRPFLQKYEFKNLKKHQQQLSSRNLNPEIEYTRVRPRNLTTLDQRTNQKNHKFQLNAVDSMIIQIKSPISNENIKQKPYYRTNSKFLSQKGKITQSFYEKESNIVKTKKKFTSHLSKKNLFDQGDNTVNSDYEEDDEVKKQKIQQSAIMINFFNPPSFIKDKLGLSHAYNTNS